MNGKIIIAGLTCITAVVGGCLVMLYSQYGSNLAGLLWFAHIFSLIFTLYMLRNYGEGYHENVGWLSMPEYVRPMAEELESLEFTLLTVVKTELGADFDERAWIYLSDDNTIVAEVIPNIAELELQSVNFWSRFPEDARIETKYPRGIVIDTKKSRNIGISNSISHAYHYHLRQIGDFTAQFGEPIVLKTYDDIKTVQRHTIKQQVRELFTYDFIFGSFISVLINVAIISFFAVFTTIAPVNTIALGVLIVSLIWFSRVELKGYDITRMKKKESQS